VTWLDVLFSHLRELFDFLRPFRVARDYERFVVFRMGMYHRTGGPGWLWLWPFGVEDAELIDIREETGNLPSQSVTTADGKTITFGCNLVYRVVDPQKYQCEVLDFDHSLGTYAMTHLHRRLREMTAADIIAGQRDLERSLEGTLSTRLKKWGAEIVSVGFTDFAQTKQFRLFNSTSAD